MRIGQTIAASAVADALRFNKMLSLRFKFHWTAAVYTKYKRKTRRLGCLFTNTRCTRYTYSFIWKGRI
jgi:hypothetical protein